MLEGFFQKVLKRITLKKTLTPIFEGKRNKSGGESNVEKEKLKL